MSLHGLALRRPVAVTVLSAAVSTLGVVAAFTLPIDLLPPVTLPRLAVQVLAPGVPLRSLEERVTEPIEAALEGVAGTTRTSSRTRDGIVFVEAEFSWKTDISSALMEARERLDRLAGTFPPGSGKPVVLRADPTAQPTLRIAVSLRDPEACGKGSGDRSSRGNDSAIAGLTQFAAGHLRGRFSRLKGVGVVTLAGGLERAIEVCLDPRLLSIHQVCFGDIEAAVRSGRTGERVGAGEFRGLTLPIRTVEEYDSPGELESLPIRAGGGARFVRLGEMAAIRWSTQPAIGRIRLDGRDVVELCVYKEPSGNAVEVAARVRDEVGYFRREYPEYRFEVVEDDGAFIRRSVDEVLEAIVLGGMLSVGVLLFSMGNWVDPLTVGLSLPVAALSTVFMMQLLDIHLNVISLAGLALGIGMLGDNATIVTENTRRLMEAGTPLQAAIKQGVLGVNLPVTASTLTNVAVFLPVLLLDGVAGRLFAQMALTMTIALLVSLVVAVTIVPLALCRLATDRRARMLSGPSPLWRLVHCAESVCRRRINSVIAWSLSHRGGVLTGAGALLILSAVVALRMNSVSAPSLDNSAVIVSLDFPPDTPPDDVRLRVSELERVLAGEKGVTGIHTEIGTLPGMDVWAAYAAWSGHAAVSVHGGPETDLLDMTERIRNAAASLEKESRGTRIVVRPRFSVMDRLLGAGTHELAIRITGSTDAVRQQAVDRVVGAVRPIPGVVDLTAPAGTGIPASGFYVDERKAAMLGLDVSAVVGEITSMLRERAGAVVEGKGDQVPVRIRLHQGTTQGGAEELLATSAITVGRKFPLRAVVAAELTPQNGEVHREDRQRVELITANVSGRSTAKVSEEIAGVLENTLLPPGCAARAGLFSREAERSAGAAWFAVLLSLVLMYVILAAEYDSYVLPLVVLLSSPLAFIGSVTAMLLAGEPLTVVSIVGLVITVGAVDNDAVVAVDTIAEKMREGEELLKAIRTAMDLRLRPIVVTSVTTLMGFLPLLFQSGSGSVLVRSLAIPLAGGIVASTIATIVVIPAAVLMVGDRPYRGG